MGALAARVVAARAVAARAVAARAVAAAAADRIGSGVNRAVATAAAAAHEGHEMCLQMLPGRRLSMSS